MGRGGAAGGSRRTGSAPPGQRPADGAPHDQGRPLGGLDAHRARRLAQGFDEQSVEVMLQARKGFTNDTYNAYRSRFCSYCQVRNLVPFEAPITVIAAFVEGCGSKDPIGPYHQGWRFGHLCPAGKD